MKKKELTVGAVRNACEELKKRAVKPFPDGNYHFLVPKGEGHAIPLDYRTTEIGRQNWEVCSRMLMHDLIDLSASNSELAAVLKHYKIGYTSNGGYTMALPRMGVLGTLPKNKEKAKK